MKIASFVADDDYGRFVQYLIELYNNTFHKTTSVFVITGETCSGKTLLRMLIKIICKDRDICNGLLTPNGFINYPATRLDKQMEMEMELEVFKCPNVFTQTWDAKSFISTYKPGRVRDFHEFINKGFTVRRRYGDPEFINHPGTLIVEICGNTTELDSLDFSSPGNYDRNVKVINLPNTFTPLTGHHEQELLITSLADEVFEIAKVVTAYDIWRKLPLYLEYYDFFPDIRRAFCALILGNLNISFDWWKRIIACSNIFN